MAFTLFSCAEPEAPKFTVTFEGVDHAPVIVAAGEKFTLPTDFKPNPGHRLVMTMGDTTLEAGVGYDITADTVLHCTWKEVKCRIAFSGDITHEEVVLPIDSEYRIPYIDGSYVGSVTVGDKTYHPGESIVIAGDMELVYSDVHEKTEGLMIDDDGVVTGYTGTEKVVYIPGNATKIGNIAFRGSSLTSIFIPNSVTSIGELAFSDSALTTVDIPSSVTTMGVAAFWACDDLANIRVRKVKRDCREWGRDWNGTATVTYDEPSEYIVHFHATNAELMIPEMTVARGEEFTLPKVNADKEGFRIIFFSPVENKEYHLGQEYEINDDLVLIVGYMRQYKLTVNGEERLVDEGYVYEIPLSVGDSKVVGVKVDGETFNEDKVTITEDTTIEFELEHVGTRYSIAFDIKTKDGNTLPPKAEESVLKGVPYTIPGIPGYYFKDVDIVVGEEREKVSIGSSSIVLSDNVTIEYRNGVKGTDGIEYAGNMVTGYSGTEESVYIPNVTKDGIPVTTIGGYAFDGDSTARKVFVPEGVELIDSNAFYYCDQLETIELPDSLKVINLQAFIDIGAAELTIPRGVEVINGNPFYGVDLSVDGTNGLKIIVADGNEHFKVEKGSLLSKDGTQLVAGCNGYIPDSVHHIEPYALYNANLQQLELPVSVESIGECGFAENDALTELNFSENKNLRTIENNAFNLDDGITSITLPVGLETIGTWAFRCAAITEITIPSTVNNVIGCPFEDCPNLTTITVNKKKADCTWNPNWYKTYDRNHPTINIKYADDEKPISYPNTKLQ